MYSVTLWIALMLVLHPRHDAFRMVSPYRVLRPVVAPSTIPVALQYLTSASYYSDKKLAFYAGASSHNALYSEQPPSRSGIRRPFESVISFVYRILKAIYNCIAWKNVKTSSSSLLPEQLEEEQASPFLNLPSTPKNKMPNINVGRIYAQNKLKEIESYISLSKKRALTASRKYTVAAADKHDRMKRSVDDLSDDELMGKRVLVRCDFNVPLIGGNLTDNTRILASLPTIQHLSSRGAKVVLCSHLGRPRGEGYEAEYSLAPVTTELSVLLNKTVLQVPDCIGSTVDRAVSAMQPGDIVMLENLRFHKEEIENDAVFAKNLSQCADVYVNDAFGTVHRAHASTEGVVRLLSPAVSGKLMQRELSFLQNVTESPARPFAVVLGGSKVASKMFTIEALLDKVDKLVLGGSMAFTFLKARGVDVGASMVEDAQLDLARRLEELAAERGVQLVLASDVVVADQFAGNATHQIVNASAIPSGWQGLDIGPQSIAAVRAALADCRTVLWTGPLGVFEFDAFTQGTTAVATTLAELTAAGCVTIVGGGDTVAALERVDLAQNVSHISTGGGATLELLEGKTLPGIAALDDIASNL